MTDEVEPNGTGEIDDSAVESVLRSAFSTSQTPPADLPDLEAAVRAKLSRRRQTTWLPIAAALAVLALVAGVVTAVRLSGDRQAAASHLVVISVTDVTSHTGGPATTLSAAPAITAVSARPATTPSSGPSTVPRSEVSRMTTDSRSSAVDTEPLPTLGKAATTVAATPLTQPSIGAEVPTTGPFVRTGAGDPLCTADTMKLAIIPGLTTMSASGKLHVTILGGRTLIGYSPFPARCTISREYLGAELRGPSGQLMAEDRPARESYDFRLPLAFDLGQQLIIQTDLTVNCNAGSGPVTMSMVTGIGATGEKDIIVPVGGTLEFTSCDPTNTAMVYEGAIETSIVNPASVDTLQGILHLPKSVKAGGIVEGSLLLANPTEFDVRLARCPDLVMGLGTVKSVDNRFLRLDCKGSVTVRAHESILVTFAIRAPKAGTYSVSAYWFEGPAHPVAPEATLLVT